MADHFEPSRTESIADDSTDRAEDQLKVSRYERVSNSVLALNILFGVGVTLMFLVWASFQSGGNAQYNLSTRWMD